MGQSGVASLLSAEEYAANLQRVLDERGRDCAAVEDDQSWRKHIKELVEEECSVGETEEQRMRLVAKQLNNFRAEKRDRYREVLDASRQEECEMDHARVTSFLVQSRESGQSSLSLTAFEQKRLLQSLAVYPPGVPGVCIPFTHLQSPLVLLRDTESFGAEGQTIPYLVQSVTQQECAVDVRFLQAYKNNSQFDAHVYEFRVQRRVEPSVPQQTDNTQHRRWLRHIFSLSAAPELPPVPDAEYRLLYTTNVLLQTEVEKALTEIKVPASDALEINRQQYASEPLPIVSTTMYLPGIGEGNGWHSLLDPRYQNAEIFRQELL